MSELTAPMSAEKRREVLAGAVSAHVASGYRVESQTDFQAILVTGRRPNHLLHLVLSILTLGLWLLVWLLVVVLGGEKRKVLTVDEFGTVLQRKGRG